MHTMIKFILSCFSVLKVQQLNSVYESRWNWLSFQHSLFFVLQQSFDTDSLPTNMNKLKIRNAFSSKFTQRVFLQLYRFVDASIPSIPSFPFLLSFPTRYSLWDGRHSKGRQEVIEEEGEETIPLRYRIPFPYRTPTVLLQVPSRRRPV